MSTTPPEGSPQQNPEQTTAQQEHLHHYYTGNAIPWYVRLIWIGFWVFAVYYTIRYLFPAIQIELFQRS